MKEKVLISIPAYNEELNIGSTIKKLKSFSHGKNWDILVVDDGSKDQTSIEARKYGVIVVRHPFNMGYGVAIQTGYKYALENGYDILAQIDADGQHDPKYIEEMIKDLKEKRLDVVIGSRFRKNTDYHAPLARRIGMIVFSFIVSLVTRRKVTDSTSGYQVISRRVLSFLCSDSFPCDYPDADLLIMLHFAGFKVDEIPMKMYENKTGKSMHGSLIKNFYYVAKMTLSIFTIVLRRITSLPSF
ncbi:glycosyltransferase family 2 protein [Patescibacteria group bacterium]|nr:glycosyltransferase family 2 protein [Patescibacteria group bacterium]